MGWLVKIQKKRLTKAYWAPFGHRALHRVLRDPAVLAKAMLRWAGLRRAGRAVFRMCVRRLALSLRPEQMGELNLVPATPRVDQRSREFVAKGESARCQ